MNKLFTITFTVDGGAPRTVNAYVTTFGWAETKALAWFADASSGLAGHSCVITDISVTGSTPVLT